MLLRFLPLLLLLPPLALAQTATQPPPLVVQLSPTQMVTWGGPFQGDSLGMVARWQGDQPIRWGVTRLPTDYLGGVYRFLDCVDELGAEEQAFVPGAENTAGWNWPEPGQDETVGTMPCFGCPIPPPPTDPNNPPADGNDDMQSWWVGENGVNYGLTTSRAGHESASAQAKRHVRRTEALHRLTNPGSYGTGT